MKPDVALAIAISVIGIWLITYFFYKEWKLEKMCKDENLPKIDINGINLYPEMSKKIVELLEMREDDPISVYAAELIRSLQAQLNYIKKGNNEVFIPPENSTNRGED